MRLDTIQRRKARGGFEAALGKGRTGQPEVSNHQDRQRGVGWFRPGIGGLSGRSDYGHGAGRAVRASISASASGGLQMGLPEGISLPGGP